MDVIAVNDAIEELKMSSTTYDNCQKLASLLIVSKELSDKLDIVEDELDDILPTYREYCKEKAQYQLGKNSREVILASISTVCQEIREFIIALYQNTDILDERTQIHSMLVRLLQDCDTQ